MEIKWIHQCHSNAPLTSRFQSWRLLKISTRFGEKTKGYYFINILNIIQENNARMKAQKPLSTQALDRSSTKKHEWPKRRETISWWLQEKEVTSRRRRWKSEGLTFNLQAKKVEMIGENSHPRKMEEWKRMVKRGRKWINDQNTLTSISWKRLHTGVCNIHTVVWHFHTPVCYLVCLSGYWYSTFYYSTCVAPCVSHPHRRVSFSHSHVLLRVSFYRLSQYYTTILSRQCCQTPRRHKDTHMGMCHNHTGVCHLCLSDNWYNSFATVQQTPKKHKGTHTYAWMPLWLLGMSHGCVSVVVPPRCQRMVHTAIHMALYISMRISSHVFCRKLQKQLFYN